MSAMPRQIIQLQSGQFNECTDAAERLLAPLIYTRAKRLVRIGVAPELPESLKKEIDRAPTAAAIIEVNAEFLRRQLNTLADFRKFSRTRGQWEAADCPKDMANHILIAGNSPHFVLLSAISTAPFLREDLTICSTPGYDSASGVFYAPNANFPPIPEFPKKDDADAAIERLYQPFSQFPYANDASRAAFLSHILTQVACHAIDTRPVGVYSAPNTGTGKSLLPTCIGLIANGVEPALRAYTNVPEEMRKVLFSLLLAGDSMIHLDNVPSGSKVRSPALCAFVTANIYGDRKLGVSESPSLPNRCSVALTGNNITPAGDFARRATIIRMDVNAETTRGRTFEIPNLKAYVLANRPRMLVDALIVIRAYSLASDPVSLLPLPSFETWSRVARDPIAWLGYGDAVESQDLETDDDIAPLRAAFTGLAESFAFGATEFVSSDVAIHCSQSDGYTLKSLLQAAGCSDATDPLRVGYWLSAYKDRVAADLKLKKVGTTSGSARWKLTHV